MNGNELRELLGFLSISQKQLARTLQINDRRVRAWCSDSEGMPNRTSLWLWKLSELAAFMPRGREATNDD